MFGRRALQSGLVTTLAAATLLAPLSGGAFARDGGRRDRNTQRIAEVQRHCNHELAQTTRGFTSLSNAITASTRLTASHKTTLTDGVATDAAALATAKAALGAATTLDGARVACRAAMRSQMVLRFDVRKAQLTSRADHTDSAVAQAQGDLDGATAAVDQLEADGADVTELRALIDDAQATLDAVGTEAGGLGDELAAAMIGDAAKTMFATDGAALRAAGASLETLSEQLAAFDNLVTPPPTNA